MAYVIRKASGAFVGAAGGREYTFNLQKARIFNRIETAKQEANPEEERIWEVELLIGGLAE